MYQLCMLSFVCFTFLKKATANIPRPKDLQYISKDMLLKVRLMNKICKLPIRGKSKKDHHWLF